MLEAEGLSPRLARTSNGWVLSVPSQHLERAVTELWAYESENRPAAPEEQPWAGQGPLYTGAGTAAALLAFFFFAAWTQGDRALARARQRFRGPDPSGRAVAHGHRAHPARRPGARGRQRRCHVVLPDRGLPLRGARPGGGHGLGGGGGAGTCATPGSTASTTSPSAPPPRSSAPSACWEARESGTAEPPRAAGQARLDTTGRRAGDPGHARHRRPARGPVGAPLGVCGRAGPAEAPWRWRWTVRRTPRIQARIGVLAAAAVPLCWFLAFS